jgi:hypothetical protein
MQKRKKMRFRMSSFEEAVAGLSQVEIGEIGGRNAGDGNEGRAVFDGLKDVLRRGRQRQHAIFIS